MIVRSANLDLLDPVIRHIYQNQYQRWAKAALFATVFNILSSKLRREIDSGYSGFGAFPVKTEGASITYVDPAQGYDYTYTHTAYAMGFEVTREMVDDDQHRAIEKLPAALAAAAVYTQELQAWAIFNNAFAAGTTYGDAKSLCATDHPLEGSGGTASNRLATDSDLSVASLKTALTMFDDLVDQQNVPIRCVPKYLVIPTALRFDACEILKSSGLANTADNNVNSIREEFPGLTPLVSPFLTDTDAWFLVAAKDDHALNFFFRTKPELQNPVTNPDTLNRKHSCYQRFSVGASGYRGVVGTPGA